jgi:hypothetical protein
MKKIYSLIAIFFSSVNVYSQNGLENVIVEKYYISDDNDTSVNDVGGALPSGSTTYRIYIDMLPGYKLQAVYAVPGSGDKPAHKLRIATSTLFFNNEDRGATTPSYNKTQARNNTVMLDSWISMGAAANGQFGVLKTDDDGVGTVVNADGILNNNNPMAGLPLTQQDGMVAGTPQPVTTLGLDNAIKVFDNQNDGTNGPVFFTSDGAWSALNGAIGPDPDKNRVLIAQLTTDGILSFELNLQLGTPTGGVERYVASDPSDEEILSPLLTYTSDISTSFHHLASAGNSFKLFPNPAAEYLTIEMNNEGITPARYVVCDMKGQRLMVKTISMVNGNYAEQLDISQLAKGYYLVEMIAGGKRSVQKFIKE